MLIRIVDDDEDLAESLKFLLEPEGWKVVSYLSAEDYHGEEKLALVVC